MGADGDIGNRNIAKQHAIAGKAEKQKKEKQNRIKTKTAKVPARKVPIKFSSPYCR